MTETAFETIASPQEIIPGTAMCPIPITVNDRAATREAIIRKANELGHQFVTRSEWHALKGKDNMVNDWDYTMIALHHAGRSFECGSGAEQMLEIQDEHMDHRYDDIGYHYGVDCSGVIYEGRDIRLKGSSVRNYNTNVIGIVLLSNYTTAGEGDDIVSFGRQILEGVGYNTSHRIPPLQVDAVLNLIKALQSVFIIQHLGGHREYPKQLAEGKICPGDIGMEFVRVLRTTTQLLPPPTS